MKIGLISDIHGNKKALDAVLEQLEEQLKMLKEQNKKKAQLYRKQLLEQIKQEQQKGLQLDKQIEEAKHTIDIGE